MSDEAALAAMNDLFAGVQAGLTADAHAEWPLVFIVGPPRSGSTLASQVLACTGAFGYVNNFVARFWKAPAVGAMIDQALGIGAREPIRSFESFHGVTDGWGQPHEFGFFWNRWFDHGQETHRLTREELSRVASDALSAEVAALAGVYGKPFIFKNVTWCALQASFLACVFPRSIFLKCERDPIFLAQSYILARRKRHGSADLWWSVRPSSYRRIAELNCWDQVVSQAMEIRKEMEESLAEIPPERIVDVPYGALCEEPRSAVRAVAERLEPFVGAVQVDIGSIPERFQSQDVRILSRDEWSLLERAMARYSDQLDEGRGFGG